MVTDRGETDRGETEDDETSFHLTHEQMAEI